MIFISYLFPTSEQLITSLKVSLGGLSFGYDTETKKYGYYKKEADSEEFVPFSEFKNKLWTSNYIGNGILKIDLSNFTIKKIKQIGIGGNIMRIDLGEKLDKVNLIIKTSGLCPIKFSDDLVNDATNVAEWWNSLTNYGGTNIDKVYNNVTLGRYLYFDYGYYYDDAILTIF